MELPIMILIDCIPFFLQESGFISAADNGIKDLLLNADYRVWQHATYLLKKAKLMPGGCFTLELTSTAPPLRCNQYHGRNQEKPRREIWSSCRCKQSFVRRNCFSTIRSRNSRVFCSQICIDQRVRATKRWNDADLERKGKHRSKSNCQAHRVG